MGKPNKLDARVAELRAQGKGLREATSQARREALAEQDRQWREAGWREAGGSRQGWGLDALIG